MNTFEGRYHGIYVSSAFDTPVHSSVSHLSEYLFRKSNINASIYYQIVKHLFLIYEPHCYTNLLNWSVIVFWIYKVSNAKLLRWQTEENRKINTGRL
jgi:hypothetical protein